MLCFTVAQHTMFMDSPNNSKHEFINNVGLNHIMATHAYVKLATHAHGNTCISMVTNQNRLTPNFRFFLFDKFESNTFLHNVLKNLVPSMSLYPSFRQLSKPAISHRDTFQRNKTG